MGQDLEIWGIPSQSNDFTATVLLPKSEENQIEKTNFLFVYLLVLRPDLDSPQDSRKVSPGIFQKKKN